METIQQAGAGEPHRLVGLGNRQKPENAQQHVAASRHETDDSQEHARDAYKQEKALFT